MPTWFYSILSVELKTASIIYKMLGLKSLDAKVQEKIKTINTALAQGKEPELNSKFPYIMVLALIAAVIIYRKKIFHFVKSKLKSI